MFEIVYDDDGRRLDGYTISSPCEPNGSGELINIKNMPFARKHCFLSDTPLFSVMTDIEYQGYATCSYPLHNKLPLEILKSSAVASTVCSQTSAYAFQNEYVTA